MTALPRMWRRRVNRRLATAAGILTGIVMIGFSLAALNGSVLPFSGWSAPAERGAPATLRLPAPVLQAQAPARLATPPLPAVGPAEPLITSTHPRTAAAAVPPAAAAPVAAHAAPEHQRVRLQAQAAPHAVVGAVAPVAVTPAPTPPAPAPAPQPVSAPSTTAPVPGRGHAYGKVRHRSIALAAAAPAPAPPATPSRLAMPTATQSTPSTAAQGGPAPGRAAHAKGLPPGLARQQDAAAPGPAPGKAAAPGHGHD